MVSKEEKEEARRLVKEEGIFQYMFRLLKEEYKENPKKFIFLFLFNMFLMMGVLHGLSFVNDEIRFCEIYKNDDLLLEGKFRGTVDYWNSQAMQMRKDFGNNYMLNCTYDIERWIDGFV